MVITWTIRRIVDSVEQPPIPVVGGTLAARKAMLTEVEALIADQPETVKAATRAAIPPLRAPVGERAQEYAVYLGGVVGSTSMVVAVVAVRTEMYP